MVTKGPFTDWDLRDLAKEALRVDSGSVFDEVVSTLKFVRQWYDGRIATLEERLEWYAQFGGLPTPPWEQEE